MHSDLIGIDEISQMNLSEIEKIKFNTVKFLTYSKALMFHTKLSYRIVGVFQKCE